MKRIFLKYEGTFYTFQEVTGLNHPRDESIFENAAQAAMDVDPDIEAYEIREGVEEEEEAEEEEGIVIQGTRTLTRDTPPSILVRSILDDIRKKIENSSAPFFFEPLADNISEICTIVKRSILAKLKVLGAIATPIVAVTHLGHGDEEGKENFGVQYAHPKTGQILKGKDLDDFLGIPEFVVLNITVAISSDEESGE